LSGACRRGNSAKWMQRGVRKEQILFINLESFAFAFLNTAHDLYRYIKENISTEHRTYIFLNEIQKINGWEKAVNSLIIDFDTDIYLTGSNSKLLSSEPATVQREFDPLLQLNDHYPKYVVTMDKTWTDNIEGIQQLPIFC